MLYNWNLFRMISSLWCKLNYSAEKIIERASIFPLPGKLDIQNAQYAATYDCIYTILLWYAWWTSKKDYGKK